MRGKEGRNRILEAGDLRSKRWLSSQQINVLIASIVQRAVCHNC